MGKMFKTGSLGLVRFFLRFTVASLSLKTSMVAAATADEGREFHNDIHQHYYKSMNTRFTK